jgi:integrase
MDATSVESCEDGVLKNFLLGFRSLATRESYLKKLRLFSRFSSLCFEEIVAMAKNDPKGLEQVIFSFVDWMKGRGVGGSTIRQHVQAIKHLLVMNDLENSLGWEKISRLMPRARKIGLDRAPTKEEMRKLLEHADIRMRALILLLSSSGIRIGSVEHLRWRHLQEVVHDGKRFAKLIVPEAKGGTGYVTFITPEAYEALLEYKKLRESEGEAISPDSPLIRVAKWSKADLDEKGAALPATSKTLRNEIHALWRRAGLRPAGARRHEVQAVHGFRKFFATRMENAGVGRLVVETLMGHRIAVASNYYKPSEKELVEAYARAIPELTISEAEEIRGEMAERLEENREKMLELERINLELQEKLSMMEKEIARLKEILLGKKKEKRRGIRKQ